ncbi:uncharacterized protein LOC129746704 [Uranotaenia lowii]|uniref:uncharacterized protein LOC129746704 n=1 Tax=Uranotaenia lowii TaxID=190385 RepID=UPI002478BAF8|nr:uncharacterized protein LOC129746704 [Uranotaenia lowii]
MKLLLFKLVAFLLAVPIAPIAGLFFLLLIVYRAIVQNVIKLVYGQHFKGFLEGLDAIWNVEKSSSRSMINVMFYVVAPSNEQGEFHVKFIEGIRKVIAGKLMGDDRPYPRLFWKRRQTLGYCFWTNDCELKIEDYVRFMDEISFAPGEKHINENDLRVLIGAISNRRLPEKHTACWELLIGTQPLKGTVVDTIRYPMLLRLHHTAGDGMAIVKLILNTIAGNHKALAARISRPSSQQRQQSKTTRVPNLAQLLKIAFNGPSLLLAGILRKTEKNCLSTGSISDKKIVSWCHEVDLGASGQPVIQIAKKTKQLVEGARFSDIFLVALAASLQKYFEQKSQHSPSGGISVIIPGRAGNEAKSLKIKNRFTTRRQQLQPTRGIQLDDPSSLNTLRQRLAMISQGSQSTRSAGSHAATSMFISTLCNLLPIALLRLVVSNFRVNVVFSILPEIEEVSALGYTIQCPTLFLPNTGKISVCLAVITFGNRVHLGILADRTVIPSEEEAHSILDGLMAEIQRMGVLLGNQDKYATTFGIVQE